MLVRKCVLYNIFHIDLLKGVWVALAGALGGGSGVLDTPLYSYNQLTVTSNKHGYSPYTQDQHDKDHSLLVIYKSIIQHLRVYIYHISHLAVGRSNTTTTNKGRQLQAFKPKDYNVEQTPC